MRRRTKSATVTAKRTKTKAKNVSSAQIEANRRNAQKSCGPKSDEGKSRSRFNALKHGMTAQTVLLPGDDGKAFLGRLQSLQEDLQPRNSLEGVAIERLAGDLWKADRAELAAGARINWRLRHGQATRQRKDREEAIKLGQHLLFQPAFPLPVGIEEREAKAKGGLGKFPLADVPGDPHHPARLLLKLEATVAGCDWLLNCWRDLRFRLEIPGQWVMNNVWKLVRLLGKTALEVKDDYQVALLVLASMALLSEPESTPDSGQQPSFAEAASAVNRDKRLSRIAAGITRLCEPFQEALARMPLDKLAPGNEAEARQRLLRVVDQELGRIGRSRAMLQQIADADEAEAPARLAFETGTEGDRGRRYILSYERLVNRRIDTFLKVRKASASGELDIVELAKELGTERLAELVTDAAIATTPDAGVLRRVGGMDEELLAQPREEPCPAPTICSVRVSDATEIDACSLRVSDPTETDDRMSPGSESSLDRATPGDEQGVAETCGREPGRARETRTQHFEDNFDRQLSDETSREERICGDDYILRNEAIATVDEPAGCGGCLVPDEPAAAAAPAACVPSQPDTSNSVSDVSQCGDRCPSQRIEPDGQPEDRSNLENENLGTSPAAPCECGGGGETVATVNLNGGSNDVIERANPDVRDLQDDEPTVPSASAAPPRLTYAQIAKLLVPMDKAAVDRLTVAELNARRAVMYLAKQRGVSPWSIIRGH